MRRLLLKESSGFTLVELMVASLISVIIMTPLAVFFINGNRMSVHTWDQTIALEDVQRVFSEIVDGRKGSRTGLRQAVEVSVGTGTLAFRVGSTIKGYRFSDGKIYRVDGLGSVVAPTSGGIVVLDNVQSFDTQYDVISGTLTLAMTTAHPSSTGMRVGGTLSTKIIPRGLIINAYGVLPVPQNLAAVSGLTSVALTWDAVVGASGYKVYRSVDGGSSYQSIAYTTTNSYNNTGLTAGSEYLYKATSIVGGVESGFSLVAVGRPGDITPPAVPSGLAAAAGPASASLSWNANSEADLAGYYIYRATAEGGPFTKLNGAPVTGTSYNNSGLTAGQAYWYYITSVDSSANESDPSAAATVTPI